jgi:hypothetical protein
MKVTIAKQVKKGGKASSAYYKTRRRGARKAPYKKRGVQQKFALTKPANKTVKALSNIAECKKWKAVSLYPQPTPIGIQQFYVSTTGSATFIPVSSFLYLRSQADFPQGSITGELRGLEGRDIFSKYLQMKLEIKYPETMFGPEGGTRPLEIVYGFTSPLNLTDRTEPVDSKVTQEEIRDHIVDIVARDFDSKDDTMEFKTRRRRAYNIIGRFKVKPNNNGLIPSPLRSNEVPGSVGTVLGERDTPPLRRNVSWPMNKKVRYRRSTNGVTSPDPILEPFVYPNGAYLPFILLYNPDYANYKNNTTDSEGNAEIRQITIRHNDQHWFNDF